MNSLQLMFYKVPELMAQNPISVPIVAVLLLGLVYYFGWIRAANMWQYRYGNRYYYFHSGIRYVYDYLLIPLLELYVIFAVFQKIFIEFYTATAVLLFRVPIFVYFALVFLILHMLHRIDKKVYSRATEFEFTITEKAYLGLTNSVDLKLVLYIINYILLAQIPNIHLLMILLSFDFLILTKWARLSSLREQTSEGTVYIKDTGKTIKGRLLEYLNDGKILKIYEKANGEVVFVPVKRIEKIVVKKAVHDEREWFERLIRANDYIDEIYRRKKERRVTVKEYLDSGETSSVEFKATARWDLAHGKVNRDLEKSIIKTIAGFLNSEGGTLLIGVSDDGKILGIQEDLNTLTKKNRDGMQQQLVKLISSYLGDEFSPYVNVRFEKVDKKEICIVNVQRSPQPVFVREGNKKEFYIRAGNTTKMLDSEKTHNHIQLHW